MDNLIDLTGYDSSDDEGNSPVLLRSPVVLSDLAQLEEALSSPITSKEGGDPGVKKESAAPPETPTSARGSLLDRLNLFSTPAPQQPALTTASDAASPSTPVGVRKLQPTASPFTPSAVSPRAREVSNSTIASSPTGLTSLEGSIFTPTVVSRTPLSPTFSTDQDAQCSSEPSTPLTAGVATSPPKKARSLVPATPVQHPQRSPDAAPTPTRKRRPAELDLNMSELVLQPGYGSSVPSSPLKADHGESRADVSLPTTPATRDGQVSEASTSRPLSPISHLTASMRDFHLEVDRAKDPFGFDTPVTDSPRGDASPVRDHGGNGAQAGLKQERKAGEGDHDAEGMEASKNSAEGTRAAKTSQASADKLIKSMLEGVGEEAGVLDKLWDRLKDEVYQFSAGIEEVVARLQGLSGGSSPADVIPRVPSKSDTDRLLTEEPGDGEAKTRPELEARCLVLSAEFRSALERRVECEVRLAKVTRDRQRLRDKEKIWERQKAMFEQKYFELEDRLGALDSEPQSSSAKRFAVVLMEGTSKLLPPRLIEKAFEGGELAAESILDSVKAKLEETSNSARQDASPPKVILIQVQLDIIALMNEYEDRGFTFKMSEIKKFLDGFASISAHINVVDGPDPDPRLNSQADFWLGVQDCVAVVLASSDPIVEEKLNAFDKLFVLGADGVSANSRIISPPVIFGDQGARTNSLGLAIKGAAQRSTTRDVSPASTVRTDYSRPDATATPRPVAPASPARTVDLLRARPLVSPPTEARGRKVSPLQSPVKKQMKPAPWAGAQPPAAPKAMLQAPTPVVSSGGSYLDRYHAAHSQTTSSNKDGEGSPTPTKPPHRPLKDRFTGRTSIVVPYAHGEEPSASPPESDEDAPSVHLPHSAVKHVQRPITINRDSGSASPVSVASSSVASSRQGGGGGVWRQTFTTMSRAVSGSNSTPLGKRQPTGPGAAGRIHGFKVHRP